MIWGGGGEIYIYIRYVLCIVFSESMIEKSKSNKTYYLGERE